MSVEAVEEAVVLKKLSIQTLIKLPKRSSTKLVIRVLLMLLPEYPFWTNHTASRIP
jgi:hypothetical protein